MWQAADHPGTNRPGHPKYSFQLFTIHSTTAVKVAARLSRGTSSINNGYNACGGRAACAAPPAPRRHEGVVQQMWTLGLPAAYLQASHASGCTARVTASSRRWCGCRTAAAPPTHHVLLYCAVVHCCMLRWLTADVREPVLYVRRDMHGVRVSCKICRW